jgi:hypothetical protein
MRYRALLLAVLLALCLALSLVVSIAAAQADASGLTLTELEWLPETVHANEELIFAVSYRKTAELSQTPAIRIQVSGSPVTATGGDGGTTSEFCSKTEEISEAAQLPVDESNTHRFAPCFIPEAGEYTVTATVMVADQAVGEPVVATLSVGPEQTALPGEFGRLFAGLGMFAAVMIIVALGTEVLIDSVKVLLGMKSKVTTMEAVGQMEKLLPGQLATLGVSANAQAQFRDLTENLNDTLRRTLKPITALTEAKVALQNGQLGTAYVALTELETALLNPATPTDRLAELRRRAKESVAAGLLAIQEKLNLPTALKDEVQRVVNSQIDTITPAAVDDLLRPVIATLSQPEWSAKATDEWLKGQRDTLLQRGRGELLTRFDEDVKPALTSLGLQPDFITAARGYLDTALTAVETKATTATDTFLAALENLLNGVEARRFAMQSPIRKVWRRLRQSDYGPIWISLLAAIPAMIIPIFGRFFICLRLNLKCGPLPAALLIYYLASLVLVLLVMLLFWWLGKRTLGVRANDQKPLPVIEGYWNQLRGQKEVDPTTFEKAPTLWEVLANKRGVTGQLTALNVAQIILNRSDQQRDEEASRQRWLRVISVIVGLALAYILQIDAAQLLDAAVPGVSGVINSIFNFSGEQMHAYWTHFPAGLGLTAGMVLTGLAASAGSAFWHDQLERLQATKRGAEAAANILKQAQDVVDTRP